VIEAEFGDEEGMHTKSSRRALALMQLVCKECVDRMGADVSVLFDAGLAQRVLHDALKDSIARLLDTRALSQGVIGAHDLAWRGKSHKDTGADIEFGEIAGLSDAADIESVAKSQGQEKHREDWASVGYDPKYKNISRLSEQDELRFVVLAKVGDCFAMQKLILHHLPLLKMVARRYSEKGLGLSELVNEGMFGLVKAIGRFDCERKVRFGTYAKWWIRDAIEQALLRQSRLIRLPGQVVRLQNEKRRAEMQAETEVRSSSSGVESDESGFIQTFDANFDPGAEAIWDEGSDGELEGIEEVTPETVLVEKQRIALLERGLAELSERERQVVIRRFGLGSDAPDTLEAVAQDLGVSYERVRQIQKAAMGKLKFFLTPHYAYII